MTTKNLLCTHCEEEMPLFVKPKLYCTLACEQEAELVRYVRRCSLDGRIEKEDIQLAVQIRMAHIMAGGYDKKSRQLTDDQRSLVFQRSQGKCEICGKEGYDIDHIQGPSGSLCNLQFLCKDCHNKKTLLSVVPIEPGSARYEYIKNHTEKFWRYVKAKKPMRPCHDQENWSANWRLFLKEREAHFKAGRNKPPRLIKSVLNATKLRME